MPYITTVPLLGPDSVDLTGPLRVLGGNLKRVGHWGLISMIAPSMSSLILQDSKIENIIDTERECISSCKVFDNGFHYLREILWRILRSTTSGMRFIICQTPFKLTGTFVRRMNA